MYCAQHETCPFFKYWKARSSDAVPLIPIELTEIVPGKIVYSCGALQWCTNSVLSVEEFLTSLFPRVRLDSKRKQIGGCSTIATLNGLEMLCGKAKEE